MTAMNPKTECPLCRSMSGKQWRSSEYLVCGSCQAVFRSATAQAEVLSEMYEASWADPARNPAETGSTSRQLARIYAKKMTASLGLEDLYGVRILELGAGNGAMALEMESMGAIVWAVEPYGYLKLKQLGLKVVRDESELPKGIQFHGILGMQVIEHLASPGERLAKLRTLLFDGGWILLSTPNRNSLNARIAGSRWREAQKPAHLLLFDEGSARNVLENSGYAHFRRLRWLHNYGRSGVKALLPYLLQSVRLDGELTVLAHR